MIKFDTANEIISGNCSLFACRCCRTKYGWNHQKWCALSLVTHPACTECKYFRERDRECIHPAKKIRKDELSYQIAECPL